MTKREFVGLLGGIILLIATCFSLFFWIENRYCLAVDFKHFAQNTKYELKSNQIEKLNERSWQLEKRIESSPKDETAREDLKRIEETKKRYEKELEELGKVK
jgi:ribosomal protein S15P/S13E